MRRSRSAWQRATWYPAAWVRRRSRARKVELLRRYAEQRRTRTLLVVGVAPSAEPWANIVEEGLASSHDTVFTGLRSHHSLTPFVRADGRQLPFRTGSVDLVVSNAVVEHVGGERDQEAFLSEHARVGRWWAATTPNRWFPAESHTNVLLLHWIPAWRRRRREFTRLLSRRELVRLVPTGRIHGSRMALTFIAFGSGTGPGTSREQR